MSNAWDPWLGSAEVRQETLAAAPVYRLLNTLDDTDTVMGEGDPLPPLWHWLYFLPQAPMTEVGADGHPKKGGFLPPVNLPRRMFAGGRMIFHAPLRLGQATQRHGEVIAINEKSGKSGRLVFVTVRYRISQNGTVRVEEEQDLVYRAPGAPMPLPEDKGALPAVPDHAWSRDLNPDPVLLFRFSALTFNSHRIHYDLPYATAEEGYPGLVVHGPLTAMMLMDLVRRKAGRAPVRFAFRGKAPLIAGQPLRLLAIPQDDGTIALQAWRCDGVLAMEAEVSLP